MSEEPKTKKPRAQKTPKVEVKLRPGLPKKEDGSYDWRQIVSPKNLMLNENWWARQGKSVEAMDEAEQDELKKTAPDEGLVIKLAGFGEIARARGVKSTRHPIVSFDQEKAVVSAEIVLLPNEDEPYETVISGVANCSRQNSTEKFFVFAEALASNRAENRAWRRYLNIQAVSDEELNPLEEKEKVRDIPDWHNILEKRLDGREIQEVADEIGCTLSSKFDGSVRSLTPAEGMTLIGKLPKK